VGFERARPLGAFLYQQKKKRRGKGERRDREIKWEERGGFLGHVAPPRLPGAVGRRKSEKKILLSFDAYSGYCSLEPGDSTVDQRKKRPFLSSGEKKRS